MRKGTFRWWSMRSLSLLYINTAITLLAANMSRYSVLLFTRISTGSDAMAGAVFSISFVPILLFGVQAGILADKYNRKKLVILSQILITAAVAVFAIGFQTENSLYWIGFSFIYSFLLGLALTFMIPARFALLGNLVPPESVGKSTAIIQIIVIAGFGLAPLATGVLKSFFSWRDLFIVTALLYFVGIIPILPVKTIFPTIRSTVGVTLKDGFEFIRKTLRVRDLLIYSSIGFFLLGPVQVVLPHFSKEHFGLTETGRGTFVSLLGFGLLVGGIGARLFSPSHRRGIVVVLSGILTGLASTLVVLTSNLTFASIQLFLAGVAGGTMTTVISSGLQALSPNEYRGRVMAIYSMVAQLIPAFSGFIVAQISEASTPEFSFVASGAFVIVFSIFALFLPGLKKEILD